MAAHATESRRDEWQKVDEIFKAMGVRPGSVVADVGAGRGYFTARLSRAVGAHGRVVAPHRRARGSDPDPGDRRITFSRRGATPDSAS
jgi:predicted methyltransferase